MSPSQELLDWRQEYLKSIKPADLGNSNENAPLLEIGNSKIGKSSHLYNKVFVWNLPVVVTCPGSSKWCLRHCYNADSRVEKFPIDIWNKNLQHFLSDEEELERKLVNILKVNLMPIAVRIHSSGDFFSSNYIKFWLRIINQTPHVKYWAYTRSWVIPELMADLTELKSAPNLQLFASWDNTMPISPDGWRTSVVYTENEILHNKGIICPEQSGKSPNCATCNYCIAKNNGDIYFILH
jgi:hypothetical protein